MRLSEIQMNKVFLPLAVDISGKLLLVVGGGEAAAHKMKALLLYGARVRVVAPEILPSVREAAFEAFERPFEKADLDGVFLAYAATSERETNLLVAREAARRGILCNVCDMPAESAFVSPAIHKDGEMSVAVSSNGRNVKKSLEWREKIIGVLGDD